VAPRTLNRAESIRRLGSVCIRCNEKDIKYLSLASGVDKKRIVLCGNCKTLKDRHPEIFSTVSPPGKASKFDIDLAYGKQKEHRFSEIAHSRIEVKSDRQARKTGNVYVEYESRGKPGGIEATDADFWAQEVDDDVFIIMPVERMKELVRRRLDKYGPTLGGDGHTSKGVLLRISELTKPLKEE
jgi:hypothetical protein